ncbi:integrin-linked kinase-associated serine/threonine phosphatase 2C isoform X1 [Takifugu rubripes]|uniref:integrin-linked kinase-associated serine/threonine phosphatase 2C isoform X1 n=2 Tax=Takifugu rubripes TaxID=31033 RepID=UPI001145D85C|nr:integrin-linked kinase-associated serine/threonine phosphatase 2C isoform X1 [Takifugu rubripes]
MRTSATGTISIIPGTGELSGAPVSTTSLQITKEKESETKTLKRKRDAEEEEEEEERSQTKVCKEGLPVLKGYVAARRGERDEMQDAHVLLPDMGACLAALPHNVCRVSYFAVFDGHGGARASQFAAENLHQILAKKFPVRETENVDGLIRKCLLDTFRQTDEDFLKKASSQKPAWKDGSTVTCLLAVDDVVYVANLGDSRAVLCRMESSGAGGGQKPVTLALSKEHNPTIYEERMRIQKAGGTVRDGRVLGVLEVSRSIGDGQYKRCGVISTPDLRRCRLTANDRFIILACHGLFKVFSADEAVKFVLSVLQEATVVQRTGLVEAELTEEELRYEAACQQLASEAVRRGCADNVTVILVSLGY